MHDGYLFLQGKQFGDSLYVGVHSDGKYITYLFMLVFTQMVTW